MEQNKKNNSLQGFSQTVNAFSTLKYQFLKDQLLFNELYEETNTTHKWIQPLNSCLYWLINNFFSCKDKQNFIQCIKLYKHFRVCHLYDLEMMIPIALLCKYDNAMEPDQGHPFGWA